MTGRSWIPAAAWLALFIFMDLFPFRAWLHWINDLDLTLAYILTAAFYLVDTRAAALALAAGVTLDALSATACHTPVFIVLFYANRLLRRLFYNPGSALHVVLCWLSLLAARAFLYFCESSSSAPLSFPAPRFLVWSAMNFALFLFMLVAFRERDRVVTYVMRR